jgi:hypothetical protein
MRRLGWLMAVAIVLTAVGACGVATPSTSEVPTSLESTTVSPSIDPTLAEAIARRRSMGLRADIAWVTAVAADPRARVFLLDIPLLPEEEAELRARQAALDEVAGWVRVHGLSNPDVYGGVYIEPARRVVVALFTRDPEGHRQAIFRRLGRVGPLEVRQVRYTERELRALAERISADWEWSRTVQAAMQGVGVLTSENLVLVSISSTNPRAPAAIVAHFGIPPDMIRVESDGTGVALMPIAWIDGVVVDADGRRVRGDDLNLNWEGAQPGRCGGGDIGYGPGLDGSFELPCTPGTWTIIVEKRGPGDGEWIPIGSAVVVVPPAGRTSMTIAVDASP